MAANKSGSGYVTLYTHSENNLIGNLQSMMPEIIVRDLKYFRSYQNNFPLLIGPGGQSIFSINEQNDIHNDIHCFVIDASAISVFDDPKSNTKDDLVKIPKFSIMTPHIGEFKKFFRIDVNKSIDLNILESVKKIIGDRIVILKSFNTFIITKKKIYIIDIGPSLLATAGTGDVLSGILVSLLSQGYSRLEASILGTYLHAEAANYYMNNISKDGMTACNLIDCIPMAFNILRNND
jgi:NAD(P)H-hydrate epimerase